MRCPSSRRGFLKGVAALPAVGAPIATTGVAIAASAEPHPDAALLAAGQRYEQARIAEKAVIDATHAAFTQYVEPVLRACSPELVITRRDRFGILGGYRWPTLVGGHVRHLTPVDNTIREGWTGELLRNAIRKAVPILGRGGQTPHRVRRWKALLPIADAFDADINRAETVSDYRALRRAETAARDEAQEAGAALNDFVASTPEGLAVLTRHAGRCDWEKLGCWANLLRSAANVSGVDLSKVHAPWERTL